MDEKDEDVVICINCQKVADSVCTSYSRDVIRITECKYCLKPVDKYIEFDIVLIFIDLILQYLTAYRHLLLNTKFQQFRRLAVLFVLCDAYEKWIGRRATELSDVAGIYQIEAQFYQSLAQSIIEITAYTMSIYAFLRVFGLASQAKYHKWKSAMLAFVEATLMGFYGNIFIVFLIIWKLHHHWSYRCLTQLFLVISHIQVQRTLIPSIHWVYNCGIVFFGWSVQQLAGRMTRHAFELLT